MEKRRCTPGELAIRARDARKRSGLSLEDVLERLKVKLPEAEKTFEQRSILIGAYKGRLSTSRLRRLEDGREAPIDPAMVAALAHLYGCSVEDLLVVEVPDA